VEVSQLQQSHLIGGNMKELIIYWASAGFRFASPWYIQISIKAPTYYYTDTAGNIHTA